MADVQEAKNKKKPRYPYTRELVQIALADGMTQEEIGQLCRGTPQSTVSAWARGKKQASNEAIRPLLAKYGHRLRRAPGKVYFGVGPRVPLEVDEEGRQCLAAEAEYKRGWGSIPSSVVRRLGIAADFNDHDHSEKQQLILQAWREDIEDRLNPLATVRVEGTIVFRHSFKTYHVVERNRRLETEARVYARWFIHQRTQDQFILIIQRRRTLRGRARIVGRTEMLRLKERLEQAGDAGKAAADLLDGTWDLIDCGDDSGRWTSTVEDPKDASSLFARAIELSSLGQEFGRPHDSSTLPLLIRKVLLELGHSLE